MPRGLVKMASYNPRQCGFCFGVIDSGLEHQSLSCELVVHITCASSHSRIHMLDDMEFSDLELDNQYALDESNNSHNDMNASSQNNQNNNKIPRVNNTDNCNTNSNVNKNFNLNLKLPPNSGKKLGLLPPQHSKEKSSKLISAASKPSSNSPGTIRHNSPTHAKNLKSRRKPTITDVYNLIDEKLTIVTSGIQGVRSEIESLRRVLHSPC